MSEAWNILQYGSRLNKSWKLSFKEVVYFEGFYCLPQKMLVKKVRGNFLALCQGRLKFKSQVQNRLLDLFQFCKKILELKT